MTAFFCFAAHFQHLGGDGTGGVGYVGNDAQLEAPAHYCPAKIGQRHVRIVGAADAGDALPAQGQNPNTPLVEDIQAGEVAVENAGILGGQEKGPLAAFGRFPDSGGIGDAHHLGQGVHCFIKGLGDTQKMLPGGFIAQNLLRPDGTHLNVGVVGGHLFQIHVETVFRQRLLLIVQPQRGIAVQVKHSHGQVPFLPPTAFR